MSLGTQANQIQKPSRNTTLLWFHIGATRLPRKSLSNQNPNQLLKQNTTIQKILHFAKLQQNSTTRNKSTVGYCVCVFGTCCCCCCCGCCCCCCCWCCCCCCCCISMLLANLFRSLLCFFSPTCFCFPTTYTTNRLVSARCRLMLLVPRHHRLRIGLATIDLHMSPVSIRMKPSKQQTHLKLRKKKKTKTTQIMANQPILP